MLVKLLTNLGSNDFPGMPFLDGEKHDVSDEVGAKLVRLRLATDVTPPPKPAVKVEPIAKAEPEAELPPAPKPEKFSAIRAQHKVPAPTTKQEPFHKES